MSEWWTYRLSDFLMFSPATYHRLFERFNQDVWPVQLVLLVSGLALVGLIRRGEAKSDRMARAMLAVCWLMVGGLFHWQRFREIHLAAGWFAAAFLLQALLLLTLSRRPIRPPRRHSACCSPPITLAPVAHSCPLQRRERGDIARNGVTRRLGATGGGAGGGCSLYLFPTTPTR